MGDDAQGDRRSLYGGESGLSLRLEINGPVANLLIDRADKRNAFNMAMWQAMPELMRNDRRGALGRVTLKTKNS